MAFTDQQVRKLKSKLKPQYVRAREIEGQTLHYLEGWHVVVEANRIFGFDAWDRETVSNSCVWAKQSGARYCAAYVARVRITVRAGDATIIREGCGSGESNETTPGQAHDRASKAAETDATKRALTTFGNCFGLTLYAGAAAQQQLRRNRDADSPPNGNGLRKQSIGNVAGALGSGSDRRELRAPYDANGHGEGGNNDTMHDPNDSAASAEGVPSALEHAAAHVGLPEVRDANGEQDDEARSTHNLARVDKSVLTIAEPRRIRDPAHLKYVAEQPCMICGRQPCEAHHLRYVQPRALARKSSDAYTVPLCALHHRELHNHGNERAWWSARGRDPLPLADELWGNSRSDVEEI